MKSIRMPNFTNSKGPKKNWIPKTTAKALCNFAYVKDRFSKERAYQHGGSIKHVQQTPFPNDWNVQHPMIILGNQMWE